MTRRGLLPIAPRAYGAVALALSLLLAPTGALGQKPGKHKPAAHAAPAKKASGSASAGSKERTSSAASSESKGGGGGSSDSDSDDSSGSTSETTVSTPSGGKVKSKTYTFGAMDVEGKLKTPQLLYFLNRVKLELDMSAPDKRSFMKELQQSADDKNL
jgi:hypothetical protein